MLNVPNDIPAGIFTAIGLIDSCLDWLAEFLEMDYLPLKSATVYLCHQPVSFITGAFSNFIFFCHHLGSTFISGALLFEMCCFHMGIVRREEGKGEGGGGP